MTPLKSAIEARPVECAAETVANLAPIGVELAQSAR
jgi:hypothetical protein